MPVLRDKWVRDYRTVIERARDERPGARDPALCLCRNRDSLVVSVFREIIEEGLCPPDTLDISNKILVEINSFVNE
jgi:hypothetical protein